MTNLEILNTAYIEAIFFTETGDEGQPEGDLTALSRAQAHTHCSNFYRAVTQNVEGFLPQLNWVQVGHDLWLTRNGHGTGFWDRPEAYGESGASLLTAIAEAMGEVEVEFEDD